MSLDDMQMTMNGQEPPMMPEMDLTVTQVSEVEISDEYISVRAGMPLEIERTFDSLSMNSEMAMEIDMMGQVQSEEMPSTASSELEGTTVTFKWDADEEEYVIAFTDGEGDKDLLEGLTADMDFRSLLPDGEVDVDDEWGVDISAFTAVMAPGGDLKLISEEVAIAAAKRHLAFFYDDPSGPPPSGTAPLHGLVPEAGPYDIRAFLKRDRIDEAEYTRMRAEGKHHYSIISELGRQAG